MYSQVIETTLIQQQNRIPITWSLFNKDNPILLLQEEDKSPIKASYLGHSFSGMIPALMVSPHARTHVVYRHWE